MLDPTLRATVEKRAEGRCEYCQLHQDHSGWRFEVDHIIAEKHGGTSDIGNLALCCPRCNQHKGPNIASFDPESGALVPLFNPRKDLWQTHFAWNGPAIQGATPLGRATIVVLNMNDPTRIAARRALMSEGVFPPKTV